MGFVIWFAFIVVIADFTPASVGVFVSMGTAVLTGCLMCSGGAGREGVDTRIWDWTCAGTLDVVVTIERVFCGRRVCVTSRPAVVGGLTGCKKSQQIRLLYLLGLQCVYLQRVSFSAYNE